MEGPGDRHPRASIPLLEDVLAVLSTTHGREDHGGEGEARDEWRSAVPMTSSVPSDQSDNKQWLHVDRPRHAAADTHTFLPPQPRTAGQTIDH